MKKISIFTDGAARGNPNGPGGYGVIISYTDEFGKVHEKELSAGYKMTTNNRMELMSVIRGLETLINPCEIDIYSDSQYVVNAFNKGWVKSWVKNKWKRADGKDVKNPDLWKRLLVVMKPHKVRFNWVKGHDGHPENERCDKLATTAADSNAILTDVVLD